MKPPTYPLRPVSGGPLDKAPAKHGDWAYEPKVNGWRALVHCPTGKMFNRHLEPLTIAREFETVLASLEDAINDPALEWLDCEAFERRHLLGKGSLVILDAPMAPGSYRDRQQRIYQLIEVGAAEAWAHEQFTPPEDRLLSFAYHYEQGSDPELHPLTAWTRLQAINKQLNCELFEGLVAKRANSLYPRQLRSPKAEFPFWVKHRWHF